MRHRWIRSASLLTAMLAACYGSPVTPDVPEPVLSIAVESGDGQRGLAGEPLPEILMVLVTDENGQPYGNQRNPHTGVLRGGIAVTWRVTSGSGGFPGYDCDLVRNVSTDVSPDGMTGLSFTPTGIGAATVTATLSTDEGQERTVSFHVEVTGRLISFGAGGFGWFNECARPGGFEPRFATVPEGAQVVWVNSGDFPIVHVASTSTPAGGEPFDSGPLEPRARFVFSPEVTGIWEYVDVVSGQTGTVTVGPSG